MVDERVMTLSYCEQITYHLGGETLFGACLQTIQSLLKIQDNKWLQNGEQSNCRVAKGLCLKESVKHSLDLLQFSSIAH